MNPPTKSRNPQDPNAGPAARGQLAEVVEHSPDTGWELWERVEKSQGVPFAPTAPASLPADLMPSLPSRVSAAAAKHAPDILDDALAEARAHNRVCLRPERWKHVYEMLMLRAAQSGDSRPPLPLIGKAWNATSAIPKRLCFQEHLMWAHQHDILIKVMAYYRTLPESDWLHMGED
jgi:hypothetical protein